MKPNRKLTLGGAGLVLVGSIAAGGVAMATDEGDSDDGDELTGQAREAAEEAVRGGTAGEVEMEADETESNEANAIYGVDVTVSDGSTVEVLLAENFTVLGIEDEVGEVNEDEE